MMLIKLLLLATACLAYERYIQEEDESKGYNDLLNLLYKKYRDYKRDTYLRGHNVNKRNDNEDDYIDDTKKSNIVEVLDDHLNKISDNNGEGISEKYMRNDVVNEESTKRHLVPVHDDILEESKNNKEMENRKDNIIWTGNVNEKHDSSIGDKLEDLKDLIKTEDSVERYHGNKIEPILKVSRGPNNAEETKTVHVIKMPDVTPPQADTYYCVAYKLPVEDEYIIEFTPLSTQQVAHHMLLFGCAEPFKNDGQQWDCREMQPVCKYNADNSMPGIMYAWAKNAPPLKMPKNVGFHVGGNSGYRYLVLQVHYLHAITDGKTDNSGVKMIMDSIPRRYLAGIYLIADGSTEIPPQKKKSYIDMACRYTGTPTLYPFRFRVHAHKLGVVITAYRVRDGKWTLIGRGDPQRPQAFYQVANTMLIENGDSVMGRCTFNSMTRDKTTYIGATHTDEMCNFYIMYFYDSDKFGTKNNIPCDYVDEELYKHYPNDSDVSLADAEKKKLRELASEGLTDMKSAVVKNWPKDGLSDGELPLTVGQIAGVDITNNDAQVVIIHRGDRVWNSKTFIGNNKLAEEYHTPIDAKTLIWLNRRTGAIIKAAGKDMFYLPHGITIDHEDNLWITDVGSHQVYKFSPNMELLLTLGEKFEPGSDMTHFCKPTDVAVMTNGMFFVSDGYCNSRVLRFDKDAKVIQEISASQKPNIGLFPSPEGMLVVHSLALDEHNKRLFVADRENGRIIIFSTDSGKFIDDIADFKGAVYAVAYNNNEGGTLNFINGPRRDNPVTLQGYTYSMKEKKVVAKWAPEGGFSLAHDLAVSNDGQDMFVVEITRPYKIWKFSRTAKTRP